jgi:2-succinyl-5-enolpyruvyl-6-hydroxy-3-cyclohexene-1-carboxylate synthase
MLFSRALAEELHRSGVVHVALAPGSRSGPLALACAALFGERASVHADERCAAFIALGAAKAAGAPAAVLCTSGTAAANLLPAAVEADRARVPLLLLTADRPPELRGCGAPQAIDQARIFGGFVRAAVELPVPATAAPVLLRALRAAADRAVATARAPLPGPVHVNVPLGDPLDPRPVPGDVPADLARRDPLAALGKSDRPFAPALAAAAEEVSGPAADRLAHALSRSRRPLVIAGPGAAPDDAAARAIAALAARAGAPLLADPLSGLRAGRALEGGAAGVAAPPSATAPDLAPVSAYDAVLQSDRAALALAPDVVLRLGAAPVSRTLARFLEGSASAATHLAVDPGGRDEDPLHLGTEHLRTDAAALARAVAARLPGTPPPASAAERASFAASWAAAGAAARAALDAAGAPGAPFFEAGLVRALGDALPAGALLFLGNSTPLRDADSFLAPRRAALRVLANRGASGIDGVLSTALGATLAHGTPAALLTGDLSLLHDAGGLLATRRRRIPLAVVVVQNDGGAIFDHLPARDSVAPEAFEALFATPHGIRFGPLATLFGLPHDFVDGAAPDAAPRLASALERALAAGTASLIEVTLPRARSLALRRAAHDAAARAAEAALGRSGAPEERASPNLREEGSS